MARANIDLDEQLVAIIMRRYGVHTKREAADLALRHVAGSPMTIAEALDMRGTHAIGTIPADQRPEHSPTPPPGRNTTGRRTWQRIKL